LAATLPKTAEFNTKSENNKILGLLNTIDCFIMRYVGLIHKFKRKICKEKTCIFKENNTYTNDYLNYSSHKLLCWVGRRFRNNFTQNIGPRARWPPFYKNGGSKFSKHNHV
jgi:hypothetical protein